MTPDQLRRLFADGILWTCCDYVMSNEWVAHKSLDLPAEWRDQTFENENLAEPLDRYLTACDESEPAEFSEPFEVAENDASWTYQHLVGHEPCGVNADVREFFEPLTPGCEWRAARASMIHKQGHKVVAPLLARIHPERGVLVLVAGYDPRTPEEVAA